ncbi:hypothetical protein [Rhodopseudomonas boonkerdii]|nr:hypothetical protein [Rhodopseudomonas boonkerdii]
MSLVQLLQITDGAAARCKRHLQHHEQRKIKTTDGFDQSAGGICQKIIIN